ncbi:transposase [Salinibacter sp. 10B]|uniref:transposase n=1 Tax=Salinibacter sp. 10B TaxID=1923971 RepID=UPI0011B0AEE9|nr:transposase [Salinibacter sp. 10B]
MFRPLGPLRADRTTIKRGSNRARRGSRPGARLRPRRVLHQDPSTYRPARPPAGSNPVSRSAPRVSLLHRPDERSIGPSAPRPRKRPEAVAGDRAYDADWIDADWIRQWCADKGIESAIPARENMRDGPGRPPTCDEQKYRDRNTVERCVGHLKERRRLVVRYEKKASHYKAMVLWAFVEEYLNR